MEIVTIYVEVDEGITLPPVFTPVRAEYLGNRFYRILKEENPENEYLRYKEGTYVFCLLVQNTQGLYPYAYCEVPEETVY